MTDKTQYPEIYKQLSGEQRRAVTHGEGPMLVTAGPGSGKTHVLTCRILYLIWERQISPGQILVITFTREAARTMQTRYLKMSEKFSASTELFAAARSGQVSFGTFHSFFYQILKSSERYTHYRIISEEDKQKLLYSLMKEIRSRREKNREKFFETVSRDEVSRILSAVSYGKNTGRGKEAGELLPEPWREYFEEIRQSYEECKEERRQLDLDDLLILTARELRENAGLLSYWQHQYPYVLVDEFQDCNPVQYEIMKMLYPAGANFFAVGDDDQAIYGFRGAEPGIMQRFLEEYAESDRTVPRHVVLGRNYRCAPEIVEASARVIACNRQRVSKRLISGRESGGSVRITGFASGREERRYVLSQCQNRPLWELDRWAVLFRTGGMMGIFEAELVQGGIPFVTREKTGSIYEHFVVRDVMDYFRAAYGCRERQIFLRIWNRPRLRIGREALDREMVDFDRIKRFYGEAPYENPAAVRDVEHFESKLKQLRKFSLELGITFVRRGFGYEDYLRQRAGSNRELLEDWLGVLEWLEEDCREHRTFGEWERCQERAAMRLSRESGRDMQNTGNGNARKKGIHILTMHAAKGLEYDRVFLMDVNEGNIPKRKRGVSVTEEMLEEERRLLYVGMTRARDCLELLYQTGTRERPCLPSVFLQPLSVLSSD